jgi:hypothetical protein
MQSTQPQFRLDYFGDDVPEWLSADDVAMVIECSYRTPAMVPPLLQALRRGRRT